MNPFKDLLGYKEEKMYDVAKTRHDNKYNLGRNYKEEGILRNSLSPFILRSQTVSEFVGFIDDYIYNLTSGIRYLKNFKNYTNKKDDKTIR